MTEAAAGPGETGVVSARARSRWFRARHEVLWLFLIAGAVRGLAAASNPALVNDSVAVIRGAERVGREGLSAAFAGPDHPLMAWLVALLPGRTETAATALSVLAGAFAVWPLHVLARRACGRHAATGACIVYAALPKAVGITSVPLTTALLLPLFLAALSLAVAAGVPCSRGRRLVRLASSGLLAGLAYLCRPEGLVAAVGAVALAVALVRRGEGRRAAAAIVAAGFLVLAAPYVVLLSQDAGRIALSPKKDVAKFVDPGADVQDTAAAIRGAASALEGALTVPVIFLVLIGGFSRTRWQHRRSIVPRTLLLGLAGLSIALVIRIGTGWGYAGAHHVLPGALLCLPFAGEGLTVLGAFVSRVVARRRLAVVLASFLAIPLAVKALIRPVGEDQLDARRLGEAIAAAAAAHPGGEVAIASFGEPLVAYYAGRALSEKGRAARDVRLWGAHRNLLVERSDVEGQRAALVETLRRERAQWLVLDLFRSTVTTSGERDTPGRRLAERLREDGVLAGPVVSPGSELAAFPVR